MNYSLSVDHSDSKAIIYVHKYATNSSEYSSVYLCDFCFAYANFES